MTCESVQLLHEMVWYWKMPATQDRWLRAPLGPGARCRLCLVGGSLTTVTLTVDAACVGTGARGAV